MLYPHFEFGSVDAKYITLFLHDLVATSMQKDGGSKRHFRLIFGTFHPTH